MKTKRFLLAAVAAAACLVQVTAHAADVGVAPPTSDKENEGLTIKNGPSSATLYGLIDITLTKQDTANATGGSLLSPRVAWFSGNRWGITGERAIVGHGDLKAIFKLESEFESQTGNMDSPGVLFNRDSWLGLESSDLGKLTFGRQNALGRDPAGSATYGDAYGGSKATTEEGGYTNNNNFKQLIYYAGSANGTRVNNGVTWKKAYGNFVAGAQYSFGGVIDSFNTGSTKTVSLAYNGENYVLAGFATNANIAGYTHHTESFGGNVQINPLIRLNAGVFSYHAQQKIGMDRSDNAWTISTRLTPGGPMDYQIGYQSMKATNAGLNNSGYVQNAYSDTSGVTGSATGSRNTLYLSTFYHLDKVTELYAAADRLTLKDGYKSAQAFGKPSANEFAVGMRFKF
jgi:predicted porin